jgi:predicted nucleotidyltransferase
LGSRLKQVWLFGSRARGDYSSDSDYDILIIAEGDMKKIREIVSEVEYRLLLEDEELVMSILYTPEAWSLEENSPLGWNIRKEGIRLL